MDRREFLYSVLCFLFILGFVFCSRLQLGKFLHSRLSVALAIFICLSYSNLQKEHPNNPPDLLESSEIYKPAVNAAKSLFQVISEIETGDEVKVVIDSKINIPFSAAENLTSFFANVGSLRRYGSPANEKLFRTYNYSFRTRGFYELNGAKYIISDRTGKYSGGCYSAIESNEIYTLYESCRYRPQFYIPHNGYKTYRKRNELLLRVEQSGSDVVFVEKTDEAKYSGRISNSIVADAEFEVMENRRNKKRVNIESAAKGVLVFNSYYDENWQAKVNGEEVGIYLMNGNQMAIPFEGGSSDVELTYYPQAYIILLYVCLLGCLAFVIALSWLVRRKMLPV